MTPDHFDSDFDWEHPGIPSHHTCIPSSRINWIEPPIARRGLSRPSASRPFPARPDSPPWPKLINPATIKTYSEREERVARIVCWVLVIMLMVIFFWLITSIP
jgi:hypothetical protein